MAENKRVIPMEVGSGDGKWVMNAFLLDLNTFGYMVMLLFGL